MHLANQLFRPPITVPINPTFPALIRDHLVDMLLMMLLLITGSTHGTDSRVVAVVNMSWDRIPLFAHVRTANFTSTDYHLMRSTLRMVTVQGTYFDGMTSEDQTG